MRLTKYQKARLLEYEWTPIENEDDNTCWLHVDETDQQLFKVAKQLLQLDDDVKEFKILIVASQTNK